MSAQVVEAASAGCQGLLAKVVKRGVEGLGFHRVQNFGTAFTKRSTSGSRPVLTRDQLV